MFGLAPAHLLLLVLVVVLLFGTGKISGLMGDVAKGIKSFKKGLADDEDATAPKQAKRIEQQGQTVEPAATVRDEQKLDS
jgi:sec-independent protein translocase protein TatA